MRTALLLFIFSIVILFAFCDRKEKPVSSRAQMEHFQSFHADGYVGDAKCVSCHSEEYKSWKGSDHDLAMQVANKETVLGDFDNVSTTIDGVSYFFFTSGDTFKVKIKEIDGSEEVYTIGYTFGVYPLQQYLVDFEKGKKQVLRVSWDVENERWFHQYSGDKIDPHDWLHWTESSQNWNSMCAECHSTNLKKNYSIEADSFHTTWSSINVSCESCHGPAEKHVHWAENRDDTLAKKTYIQLAQNQTQQLNTCAPCHARRAKLTANMTPGVDFNNQYILQNITDEFYHKDGQIESEDYVYGSFLQSKMYHNDVMCSDCHDMHSTKLKLEGNSLCMQCHEPEYDTPGHHFHQMETESADCVSCHMTGETYMEIDFRRDHSFRIPRPDQSVKYGTPNACTQCHDDKSDQWAADQIVEWYGPEREDHFSDALLVSNQEQISGDEREALFSFISDLKYPAIARATVIENLEIQDMDEFRPVIGSLKDASPLVRFSALQKFRDLSPADRVPIAAAHIGDNSRSVRVAAAQLLTGIPDSDLQGVDQSQLREARAELRTMLEANADFSDGRMHLADYYLQKGEVENGIEAYLAALKKDSLLLPVYPNLAIAYSSVGQTGKALNTLNILIRKTPDYARAYYLRGLLNFELKKDAAAVADLKKAIALDPTDTRSSYNLATYYYQNKDWQKAEEVIEGALRLEPQNGDYRYLLALIYQGQGQEKKYVELLQQLQKEQQARRTGGVN